MGSALEDFQSLLLTLLHREGGAPLGAAADALVVSDDNEMQVGKERLQLNNETLPVGDKQPVCCLHVCNVGLERAEELVAKETLLLVEDGIFCGGFDQTRLRQPRRAGCAAGVGIICHIGGEGGVHKDGGVCEDEVDRRALVLVFGGLGASKGGRSDADLSGKNNTFWARIRRRYIHDEMSVRETETLLPRKAQCGLVQVDQLDVARRM